MSNARGMQYLGHGKRYHLVRANLHFYNLGFLFIFQNTKQELKVTKPQTQSSGPPIDNSIFDPNTVEGILT